MTTNTDSEKKILALFGAIAKTVEESGCTFSEAEDALYRLMVHYNKEGKFFLDSASIESVVKFRQRLFERAQAGAYALTTGVHQGGIGDAQS